MPVRDDILTPISDANPSGVDLIESGDTVLSDIREARKEDPAGSRRPDDPPPRIADWPRVQKLCNDTLAKKSKDLVVASFLVEAMLKREGLPGFRAGLAVMQGLLDAFWTTLYPSLEPVAEGSKDLPYAGRILPLQWLGARHGRLGRRNLRSGLDRGYLHAHFQVIPLCKAGHGLARFNEAREVGSEAECHGDPKLLAARQEKIDAGRISVEDFDRAVADTDKAFYKALVAEVAACRKALDDVKAVTVRLMPDAKGNDAVEYEALYDELGELADLAGTFLELKLKTDPDPPEADPEPSVGTGPQAGAARTDTKEAWTEPRTADEATQYISQLAEFLRKQRPTNPGPYLMLRGLRWGELRAGGPDIDPKLLVAPPTHVRSLLKGLSLDHRWKDLLEQGERVMARPDGRGWLDLQRHVVTACDQLGSEYERVGAAIRGALAMLLRDLPTLVSASLMDDTPTANGETRRWLQDQGLFSGAGDAIDEMVVAAPAAHLPRQAGDVVLERAMESVRAGQPKRAVEILMHEAARERSPRGRFLRMTQVASVMVDSDLRQMALPILDELDELIRTRSLEGWETGDVVAQPLALLYQCLPADSERRDALYQVICKLDPVRAINLP